MVVAVVSLSKQNKSDIDFIDVFGGVVSCSYISFCNWNNWCGWCVSTTTISHWQTIILFWVVASMSNFHTESHGIYEPYPNQSVFVYRNILGISLSLPLSLSLTLPFSLLLVRFLLLAFFSVRQLLIQHHVVQHDDNFEMEYEFWVATFSIHTSKPQSEHTHTNAQRFKYYKYIVWMEHMHEWKDKKKRRKNPENTHTQTHTHNPTAAKTGDFNFTIKDLLFIFHYNFHRTFRALLCYVAM